MEVDERLIHEAAGTGRAPGGQVGAAWFAARQPGIVAYLENRCGIGSDALAVALSGAIAVHDDYHGALGTPPPRVRASSRLFVLPTNCYDAHCLQSPLHQCQ